MQISVAISVYDEIVAVEVDVARRYNARRRDGLVGAVSLVLGPEVGVMALWVPSASCSAQRSASSKSQLLFVVVSQSTSPWAGF